MRKGFLNVNNGKMRLLQHTDIDKFLSILNLNIYSKDYII